MAESSPPSNDEWFAANLLDLVQKYPNQWIAVLDGTVICTSSSRRRVRGEARRLAGGRDFSLYFIEPSMLQMGFARGGAPPEQPPG
jgi:hypothetical protein